MIKATPTATYFASSQYSHFRITTELAKVEKNPHFKKILEDFAKHEKGDFEFWKKLTNTETFVVSPIKIFFLKILRKILGLTFIVKYLEREEEKIIKNYTTYLGKISDPELKKKIKIAIAHETKHEKELINQIKEERVEFISSIVLGINDGLIELTGALVGFSFALQQNHLIALTGFITGIAASLSMASSAYMQAQYEKGKHPGKAAVYTGIAYVIVVFLLIIPFVLSSSIHVALAILLFIVLGIIGSISYYTSILFTRSFIKQFLKMMTFTLGVALITFLLGLFLRVVFGIEV
ncbi:VIT1/CCC1 transporter family protein [Candidatus Woesearchaeota archaeon]|nr:VIT1/CCC1 transporter family protein [Candidatus Woesearchaeota archaeon]